MRNFPVITLLNLLVLLYPKNKYHKKPKIIIKSFLMFLTNIPKQNNLNRHFNLKKKIKLSIPYIF